MILSIAYAPSKWLRIKEAFSLITAGFLMLAGRQITINHVIERQQVIDALMGECVRMGNVEPTPENQTNDQG
ncbi:hypothetical protein DOE63_24160 [Salmonella enterica subsp. diarizonae serovar 59:z10:-]|nr:hypothetical protein DOE63_24160 [Salmonella enterica subsp. diarizonae serovar 59:z10:-]